MLHREYFPFLPNIESEPRGPVDHPQLEAEAPPRWWEESAQLLFGAAENIARLLFEGSECGIHLMTPFTGFCAFSAGYLCLYVSNFPRMNLGRSPDSTKHLKMCLDYLERFRDVWAIGDGWVCSIPPSLCIANSARLKRFSKPLYCTSVQPMIDNDMGVEHEMTLTPYTNQSTNSA